jgi:hypothetical protein
VYDIGMQTRTIVQLANGNYVEAHEYSQGYFSMVETEDIFQACTVPERQYMTFFRNDGARFLTVEFTANIVKVEV